MHIDWTVNIGNVAAVASVIVVLLKMHTKNVRMLESMKVKLDTMWVVFMKDHIGVTHHEDSSDFAR